MTLYKWQCVSCFNVFKRDSLAKDIWTDCPKCGMRAAKIEPSQSKIAMAVDHGVCVLCGYPAMGFREVANSIEYLKSGLCQACQDSTSGPEDLR